MSYSGIVNRPIQPMQNSSTTKKYATQLECFLAMLLRPQGSYITAYPGPLAAAIEALREALSNQETVLEPLIDLVLDQIWMVEWKRTPTNKFPDPTQRYLMLATRRSDGTFLHPKDVTPILAKFKYLIRVHMARCMADEGPRSKDSAELNRWFHEKRNSSFSTVCDLQHYASAIAMATQELPSIFWIE